MSTNYVPCDLICSLWMSSPSFKCQQSSAWGHLHRAGGQGVVTAGSSFPSPEEAMQQSETLNLPRTSQAPSPLILFSHDGLEEERQQPWVHALQARVSPPSGTQAPSDLLSPGHLHSPHTHPCPPVEGAAGLSPSSGHTGVPPARRHCSLLWGNSPQCPAQLPPTFQDCLLLVDDLIVPPKRRFFFSLRVEISLMLSSKEKKNL